MAMDLQEYFRLRCVDTQEALQNMQTLFSNLLDNTSNPQLVGILQQQNEMLQANLDNMNRITGQEGKRKTRTAKKEVGAAEEGERLVIVGRTWTGTIGRGTVEHYRMYVTQIPAYLVEINAAMLSEEVTHFNLGNFTGLIVLAKELGETEAANLLQENIDRETQVRGWIESSLWQIVGDLHPKEKRKAA